MFTLAGPAGFYGTPVTKVLLSVAIASYVLLAFPLHHLQPLFHYSQDVWDKQQLKRMLLSKLVCLDLHDLVFSSVLLYNFRIFERRFGSRKFMSFVLTTTALACMLELLTFSLLSLLDIHLGTMPAGLLSSVFPLFIPFHRTIPRVAQSTIMGVPVTGKTLNYIFGLQITAQGAPMVLIALCSLAAGALWTANVLGIQALSVPRWLARGFELTLGRYMESADTTSLPYGATLELQQKERLDRIEQQMMQTAMQASSVEHSARPALNLPLAQGLLDNLGAGDASGNASDNAGPSPASPVSEDQVRRFVEMGFLDSQARHALRATNNNAGLATHLLLQGT